MPKITQNCIHIPLAALFIILLFCTLFLTGCYSTPVRHLTSDVSLLKEGVSTDNDVIVFLGRPDFEELGENGVIRWIYQDRRKSFAQKLPLIGTSFGEEGRTTVIVSLQNHIVTGIDYHTTAPDELGWQRRAE